MEWKNSLINYLLIVALGFSSWIFFSEISKEFRDVTILFISFIFGTALIISLFFYNRKAFRKEEQYQVILSDEKIRCIHPEKPNEFVLWKEISEVTIVTTDKGPHEPYIWILLSGEKEKGCIFPLGAKNSRIAIEKILGFSGLNLTLWGEALKSTENKRFVVWKKPV